MGESLTTLQQVRALIERLTPKPICHECVIERLSPNARLEANSKIVELAGMNGFERRVDTCSMCCGKKKVIRRLPF
ncbi:hypothetical protein IAG41_15800 [Sphingomonas sp. JC676]|nr:hypothetical protein [Sphingomonas sp. JC676]